MLSARLSVATAARSISPSRGVENRARAPFVMGTAEGAFACNAKLEDPCPT